MYVFADGFLLMILQLKITNLQKKYQFANKKIIQFKLTFFTKIHEVPNEVDSALTSVIFFYHS